MPRCWTLFDGADETIHDDRRYPTADARRPGHASAQSAGIPLADPSTPAGLRARRHGTLPADVAQALLDAAAELEASEEAFAELVEQKRELQRRLANCESNLRAALARPARA